MNAIAHRAALVLLCSAYIQGGLLKLLDLQGAVAEMHHFGIYAPGPVAGVVISIEIFAPLLVLIGRWRWQAAVVLGVFTAIVTCIMNEFWTLPAGPERLASSTTFLERMGLAGGFVLVALHDLGQGQGAGTSAKQAGAA